METTPDGKTRSYYVGGTNKYVGKHYGPSVLFKFAEENVLVAIEKTRVKATTVYEKKTLGTSEFFPKQALNHIVPAPLKPKTNEFDESYDLKHVIDSISPALPVKMRQKIAKLVQEIADIFP